MAPEMRTLCQSLAERLLSRGWMLSTAESCTGGLIAAACTELAGSSQWFERGFVTYSNAAKTSLLGVSPGLIGQYGAVSQPVVESMAQGALRHSPAQVALAVTGIAGPGGGSADKPVGTVWFGWATPQGVVSECLLLPGERSAVRAASTRHALAQLCQLLDTGQLSGLPA
jgi:nicotinamide-nucleotide amidase